MITIAIKSVPGRVAELREELAALLAYPEDELTAIIGEVGFACTRCGRCCTREFNDHVFLVESEHERIRRIDPGALVPAPYYEFCDQYGRFYVSGYALRTHEDGSCIFLEEGRCRIYEERLAICRVYPYMLHREADEDGRVDWRQISGLNRHGEYHAEISAAECSRIARMTREFEAAQVRHQIAFLEFIDGYFDAHGLRHVRRTYDMEMRRFREGAEIEVFVFAGADLDRFTVTRADYPGLSLFSPP